MKRLSSDSQTATAGFTLLEVLVVMIIAGILMGIAAPNWLAYLSNRRVVAVRDEVKQILEEAQNRARAERQSQIVTIYNGESLPTVSVSSTTGTALANQQTLGGDNIRENLILLSTTVDGSATASGTSEFEFDYQGLVDDAGDLPFIVHVGSSDLTGLTQRCVIVPTILGSITTGDGDECSNTFIAD